jgi:antitoxin VapB
LSGGFSGGAENVTSVGHIPATRSKKMNMAKVFTNGDSQLVMLPTEFRFNSNEVYVSKHDGKVILSEKPNKTWAEIFKDMPAFPDFDVNREAINDKPREVNL